MPIPALTTLRRSVGDRFAGVDGARVEKTALVLLGVEFQVEAWIGVPGPVGRHLALSALCLAQAAGMLLKSELERDGWFAAVLRVPPAGSPG